MPEFEDRIRRLTPSRWRRMTPAGRGRLIDRLAMHEAARIPPQDRLRRTLERILTYRSLYRIECEAILDRLEKELADPHRASHVPGRASPEALHMLLVARRAGDTRSVEAIERILLDLRRWAGAPGMDDSVSGVHAPYEPSRRERELIGRLLRIFVRRSWLPAPLPRIVSSWEIPPLLATFPGLDTRRPWPEGAWPPPPDVPESMETPTPESDRMAEPDDQILPEDIGPDIESLLGYYVAEDRKIVLLEQGLWFLSEKYDPDRLREVVLVHELGHWIMHAMPDRQGLACELSLYRRMDSDLHETWAQLVTHWIAEEVQGEFRNTFQALNRNQSRRYRLFQQFTGQPRERVIEAMEGLRLQPPTARSYVAFKTFRQRLLP